MQFVLYEHMSILLLDAAPVSGIDVAHCQPRPRAAVTEPFHWQYAPQWKHYPSKLQRFAD